MKPNLFNSVKMTRPNSNVFDLSHDVKLSANMGYLIPTLAMEAVPGDKFNIGCESLLRFAPLVSPVMHMMSVTMHYFFVPNRILWPNWEKFITNTKLQPSDVLPAHPFLEVNQGNYTELMDYMGVPTPIPAQTELLNALPFAAFQCVYNEYYRDQNLIDPIEYKVVDGNNTAALADLCAMRKRAWEHDYFTSGLPFAQKGDPVNLPLAFEDVLVRRSHDDSVDPLTTLVATANPPGNVPIDNEISPDFPVTDTLYADTSELQGTTNINDLRRATALQTFLEKLARGGSRLTEYIRVMFGVRSSDARLQRPEYITGTKSPVQISEVLNTTGTEDLPQGNMAGHAISVTAGKYGNYFCEEHGFIIGVMSVMPKTAYQQGLHRMFFRDDPFDYYQPPLANIGEQEVLNKEIYAWQGAAGLNTFAYNPRYAEYKFMPSRVSGEFRSTLDFWHLGRIFATPPSLNQDFIECTPDTRIFAVEDPEVQKLYCHVYHKIRAVRRMPKFGTPTF